MCLPSSSSSSFTSGKSVSQNQQIDSYRHSLHSLAKTAICLPNWHIFPSLCSLCFSSSTAAVLHFLIAHLPTIPFFPSSHKVASHHCTLGITFFTATLQVSRKFVCLFVCGHISWMGRERERANRVRNGSFFRLSIEKHFWDALFLSGGQVH